ncbi:PD-(D/E)XK nuclease family protein [Legionella septentrionalis]|uniref:PD-(D/E)XK nuclease family protein n=1 Tax=Legionella septentrionalis TaxID=2498109 RepID=UPI000F8DEE92|nr:PD-(D/E)XK nuclease family protein [Legionella septentrionalis]RUR17164.1 PD-(D/E)XK nuclease family protein [Legionella septentrionalis]
MLTILETKDALFAKMQEGAFVITPNNRLSQQLVHDFFTSQATDVRTKPHCLPYQVFLQYVLTQVRHRYAKIKHPILLTQAQQRYLWHEILLQTKHHPSETLIDKIEEAWTRCQLWKINPDHEKFLHTPQTQQFIEWQYNFQKRLHELHAITKEQIIPYILSYPEFHTSTVIWACFNDFTPEQHLLQQALVKQGCRQYAYDLFTPPEILQEYAAKDEHDEYLRMTHWINERLQAGDRRIAVVVPNLQEKSRYLQRFLQQQFDHQQFNISLGEPLSIHPLVAHALAFLSLNKRMLSNLNARLLLHTPYIAGSHSEFLQRAQFLQEGKLLQEAEIPFSLFAKELNATAPKLSKVLTGFTDFPQQASPAEWTIQFKKRLDYLEFPGEYALDSTAFQYLQRLLLLLEQFLELTVVTPLLNKEEALSALSYLAKTTIFQVKKASCPVQILGLLEAAGCTFDSMWICGLTDQCLPEKINLSAFIPIEMQRAYKMPHSLPALEAEFARRLLLRLKNGSRFCVLSYPKLSGDMPNLPSPLLQASSKLKACESLTIPHHKKLVLRQENYHIPLTAEENIAGGTALLANQAKCPFRAFAAHRLHAKAGLLVSTGPNSSERGQLMHSIMDKIWQYLSDQKTLLSLPAGELKHFITNTIADVLKPYAEQRPHSFPPVVQEIEFLRLTNLVEACLEWEKTRPPFKVEALEKTFAIRLAGIDFNVRVDRLDQLIDREKKWVIDYKSLLPAHKPWNEERPEEPQLLLYALLDKNIRALLFLQLRAGRLLCAGLSEEILPLAGISPVKKNEHWTDYQQKWQEQLHNLAEEFQQGYCPPLPKRASTCQYCDFQKLCRNGLAE